MRSRPLPASFFFSPSSLARLRDFSARLSSISLSLSLSPPGWVRFNGLANDRFTPDSFSFTNPRYFSSSFARNSTRLRRVERHMISEILLLLSTNRRIFTRRKAYESRLKNSIKIRKTLNRCNSEDNNFR